MSELGAHREGERGSAVHDPAPRVTYPGDGDVPKAFGVLAQEVVKLRLQLGEQTARDDIGLLLGRGHPGGVGVYAAQTAKHFGLCCPQLVDERVELCWLRTLVSQQAPLAPDPVPAKARTETVGQLAADGRGVAPHTIEAERVERRNGRVADGKYFGKQGWYNRHRVAGGARPRVPKPLLSELWV